MKQPTDQLPEPERLSDYKDHLVVFANSRPGETTSTFGVSELECDVWVHLPSGVWKALGETPIFWRTVAFQVRDAAPEPVGGILTQGTDRNDIEWVIVAVPAADKVGTKTLAGWSSESGAF